jgi:dTDP-4-amino-4,6-dideoxygalactose transaminase
MQFIDLKAQQDRLKADIDAGIASVLGHGQYIFGPEVAKFEDKLAEFSDAKHAVSCANGTDAILLPLLAWGVGVGDAVFCPSFTYCATAEVIALTGATPIFIDIDRETYNLDVGSLKQAISDVKSKGDLRPAAVIVVDLFGQSADYEAITPIVRENGLKLISDSAQGYGSTLKGKHPLNWADVQTTSFFPAKPLGCYGDGGATMTNDDTLDAVMRSLRFHGKGKDQYDNVRIGINSRLDTLQAAILLPKLAVFADEIEKRNVIAERYSSALRGYATRVPVVLDSVLSTWAQYTLEVPDPQHFADGLKAEGIPTARYYPKPVHMQTAYAHYPVSGNGLPNTVDCIDHVISLPMHPYLSDTDQDRIIETAKAALA